MTDSLLEQEQIRVAVWTGWTRTQGVHRDVLKVLSRNVHLKQRQTMTVEQCRDRQTMAVKQDRDRQTMATILQDTSGRVRVFT